MLGDNWNLDIAKKFAEFLGGRSTASKTPISLSEMDRAITSAAVEGNEEKLDELVEYISENATKEELERLTNHSSFKPHGENAHLRGDAFKKFQEAGQKVIEGQRLAKASKKAGEHALKAFGEALQDVRAAKNNPDTQKALVAVASQDVDVCKAAIPYMSESSIHDMCVTAQMQGNKEVVALGATTPKLKDAVKRTINALKITHVTDLSTGETVEAHKYITDGKGFVSMDSGKAMAFSNSTALESPVGQKLLGAAEQMSPNIANNMGLVPSSGSDHFVPAQTNFTPGQTQIEFAVHNQVNYGALLGQKGFSMYDSLPPVSHDGNQVALFNPAQGQGVHRPADNTALYAMGAIVAGKAMYAGYKYMTTPKKLTKKEQETLKLRDAWFDILEGKGNFKAKMESFLKKHKDFDPNVLNPEGKSAIHILSDMDRRASIDFLVSKGVSLDLKDRNGQTPLHHAVEGNNLGLIKHMLKKGANVHVTDAKGRTPQEFAEQVIEEVHYGDRTPLSDELDKGPDFMRAVRNGDRKTVHQMHGADPHLANYRDELGNSVAHVAAIQDNAEMLRDLHGLGADMNAKNPAGHTPLEVAEHLHEYSWTKRLNDFGGVDTPKSNVMQFLETGEKQWNISPEEKLQGDYSQLDDIDKKLTEAKTPAELVKLNNDRIRIIDQAVKDLQSTKERTTQMGVVSMKPGDVIDLLSKEKAEAEKQIGQVAALEKTAMKVHEELKTKVQNNQAATQIQKLFRGVKGREKAKEQKISNEISANLDQYNDNLAILSKDDLTAAEILEAHKAMIFSGKRALELMDENPKAVAMQSADQGRTNADLEKLKAEMTTEIQQAKGAVESLEHQEMWKSAMEYSMQQMEQEQAKQKAIDKEAAKEHLAEYVQGGHYASVSVLLDNQPDLKNAPLDKDGNTAMHMAAAKGDKDMLETLVAAGVDAAVENNAGKTPLEVAQDSQLTMFRRAENIMNPALEHLDTPAIEFLKEEQQAIPSDLSKLRSLVHDLKVSDNARMKETHLEHITNFTNKVIEEKGIEYFNRVLDKLQPEERGVYTEGKLTAMKNKARDAVRNAGDENLEAARASAETRSSAANEEINAEITKLFEAAKTGNIQEAVAVLKDHPEAVNIMDADGNTALHLAAKNDKMEILKLLVENGARVTSVNTNGETALDIATERDANSWDKTLNVYGFDTPETPAMKLLRNEELKLEVMANMMQEYKSLDLISKIDEDRSREDLSEKDLKTLTKASIDNLKKVIKSKENINRIITENPELSLPAEVKENYADVKEQLSAARTLLKGNEDLEKEMAATTINKVARGAYVRKAVEQHKAATKIHALLKGAYVRKAVKQHKAGKVMLDSIRNHMATKQDRANLANLKAEDKHARENLVRLASSPTGYIADVEAILIKHPKLINAPLNDIGDTVLHIAARNGHLDLSKALVERGADVFQENYELDNAYDAANANRNTYLGGVDIGGLAGYKDSGKVADYLDKEQDAVIARKDLEIRQHEAQTKIAKVTRGIAGRKKADTAYLEKELEAHKLDQERLASVQKPQDPDLKAWEDKRREEDKKRAKQEAAITKEMGDKAKLFAELSESNTMEISSERKQELQAGIKKAEEAKKGYSPKVTANKTPEQVAEAIARTQKANNFRKKTAREQAKNVVGSSLGKLAPIDEITPESLYKSIDDNPLFKGRDNLKILMSEFLDEHEKANKGKLKDFAMQQKVNLNKTVEDKAAALGRKMTGRATDADLFKEIVTNLAEGVDPLTGIADAKDGKFIKASKLQSKNQGRSQ